MISHVLGSVSFQKKYQNVMSKLRVVDVTNFLNSDQISGVERILLDFCDYAKTNGINLVFVYFCKGNFYTLNGNRLPRKLDAHTTNTKSFEFISKALFKQLYFKMPFWFRSYAGYIRVLTNAYKPMKFSRIPIASQFVFSECDLYVFDFVRDPRHLKSLHRLLRSKKVRLHTFIHDIYPIKRDMTAVPELKIPFNNFLKLVCLGYKCFVPSRSTSNELKIALKERNTSIDTIEVFRFPIPKFVTETESCLPGFSATNFTLYVSSFLPRKNHEFLIKSFDKFVLETKNFCTLVLVGSGQHNSGRLHSLFKTRDKNNAVEIFGNLPECCLAKLYRLSSFTIYPSLHEGFGLPVLESIHFQKWALVSDVAATAEFGNFDGVILFNPESYSSFKSGMLKVMSGTGRINRGLNEEFLDNWSYILN